MVGVASDAFGTQVGAARCRNGEQLLMLPGTDGKHSCGTRSPGRRGFASPLSFVPRRRKKTAMPAEPAWPLGGIASDASAALGVQGGDALPRRSLSSGAAGKTATPAEPAWPLGGIGKRCLGGTGVDPARRLAASPFSGSPTAAVASGDAGARGRAAGPAVCPEHRSTRRPTAGSEVVGRAPSTLAPRRRHRS